MIPNLHEEIEKEQIRIEAMTRQYSNQQHLSTILQKLRSITDDDFVDLEKLQQPKGKPPKGNGGRSDKRLPIDAEIQESQIQKKAKTPAGREALNIR